LGIDQVVWNDLSDLQKQVVFNETETIWLASR